MRDGKTALIGHSGFVGGTLLRERPFDDLFNSSNIGDIAGASYDTIVCAGVSAVKWLANKDPDADREGIARLTGPLATVRAREFVLISTIDVYPDPAAAADESAGIDPSLNHPYGAHRYQLEQWVQTHFPDARIVRLPALFGPGLRKNALYDLLNGNDVGGINPLGEFQWYPLHRLWGDLDIIRAAGLRLVNLFGQAVAMSDVADAFFPCAALGSATKPAPSYNLRTRYADLFGGANGYILRAETILGEMARYIAAERRLAVRRD